MRDLAWVMSNPCLLAVVLANGMLLVWDQAGEGSLAGQNKAMGPPGSHNGTRAAKKLSPRPGYHMRPLLHCSSTKSSWHCSEPRLIPICKIAAFAALPAGQVPGDGMLLDWDQAGAQLPLCLNRVFTKNQSKAAPQL